VHDGIDPEGDVNYPGTDIETFHEFHDQKPYSKELHEVIQASDGFWLVHSKRKPLGTVYELLRDRRKLHERYLKANKGTPRSAKYFEGCTFSGPFHSPAAAVAWRTANMNDLLGRKS
jgi:hypothetical protein